MPSSFVLPGYCTRVASFTTVMSAPAITFPEGSSTRPLIVPLGDCALRGTSKNSHRRERTRHSRNRTWHLLRPKIFLGHSYGLRRRLWCGYHFVVVRG